jgi:hemerythrin superfamily protein
MITNSNGDKVSAKEAAKEALAAAIKKVVNDGAALDEQLEFFKAGGSDMTEKESAKVKEQLDKISARLLSKLEPAAGKVQEG